MNAFKDALRQRNRGISYIKKYVYHMRIPVALRQEIDRTFNDGEEILDEIENMFWADIDFIDGIISYLIAGERIITRLEDETEVPNLSELLFSFEIQRKIFIKTINEQIFNSDEKITTFTERNFPIFHNDNNHIYNYFFLPPPNDLKLRGFL
jgi:hypothetical protein